MVKYSFYQKRDQRNSDGRVKGANDNGCSRMPVTDGEGKRRAAQRAPFNSTM